MVVLTPASTDEIRAWQEDWLGRQRQWRAALGYPEVDVAAWLDRCVARRTADAVTFVGRHGAQAVGFVALSPRDGGAWGLDDLWVAPEHRRRGHGSVLRRAAEQWSLHQGAATLSATCGADVVHEGLFGGYRLVAQHMARRVKARPVLPTGLVANRLTGPAFDEWALQSAASYARGVAAAGVKSIDAAVRDAVVEVQRLLPDGAQTTGHSIWALHASGAMVASVWLMHHWGEGRSFVYSVAVDENHRGRGFGKAAMWLGEQLAHDAGDQVVELNVFGDNTTAMALYERLGYLVTEQYRTRNLSAARS